MDSKPELNILMQIHIRKVRDKLREEKPTVLERIQRNDRTTVERAGHHAGKLYYDIARECVSIAEGFHADPSSQVPIEVIDRLLEKMIRANTWTAVYWSDEVKRRG